MSTLSGIASKGEKAKPKFQSLDINNLYRVSRGESLEPHQQKNALPRKTGMQSLGKLPSARRPPANLPSLKSEHSGNDPAISLVPSGGSGWGASKSGEPASAPAGAGAPATPPTPNTTATSSNSSQPPQTAATLSSVTPTPAPAAPANAAPAPPPNQVTHGHTAHTSIHPHLGPGGSGGDKSWSSIMLGGGSGNDPASVAAPSFLAHQSPLFQQEFPSLSSGDGQGSAAGQKGGSGGAIANSSGPEAPYGPGPSLRPQSGDVGGGRNNLGPLGPQAVGMGPAGQANGPNSGSHPGSGPLAGQAGPLGAFRGMIMPPFLCKAGFPGPFPPNFQGPVRPRFPYPQDSRLAPSNRSQSSSSGRDRGRDRDRDGERDGDRERDEDILPRPIIKEEDLNRMDDIGRDAGWALHDDIDYNQKLTFSDDESTPAEEQKKPDTKESRDTRGGRDDRERDRPIERDRDREPDKERDERDRDRRGCEKRWQGGPGRSQAQGAPTGDFRAMTLLSAPVGVSGVRVPPPCGRVVEEEEIWCEQRRKQNEEMALIKERAQQRKEEEEKRYEQAKAQKKLELESKMKNKEAGGADTTASATGSGAGATESRDGRDLEDKPLQREAVEFRQLNQIERPSFLRERDREREIRSERDRDRDLRAERISGHGEAMHQFSRQFQSNLPPRFQKQQAERHASSQASSSGQSFDQRWALPASNNAVVYQPGKAGAGHGPGRRNRSDGEAPSDREREPLDDRPPSRDPRDSRDRRERHTPEADRYRAGRDRDYRNKGYYEGPEYGRYGRGPDYRGPDYDRKERDGEEARHREAWDRFDDRRGDSKKDYKPHSAGGDEFEDRERDINRQDSGEWREKDRDKSDRRDRRDSRERDLRDRDNRDVRDRDHRREYRDPRDRDIRDIRSERDRDIISRDRDRDIRDVRGPRERDDRDIREPRDLRERDSRERDLRERDLRESADVRENRGPRERRDRGPRDVERDRDIRDYRDRDERPQRPDSRDSRASRDSRNSRDSDMKLEGPSPGREFAGSWTETPFDPHYESKDKRHRDLYRGDRRDGTHVPGPVTQDKLAALDDKNQYVRLERIPTKQITMTQATKLNTPTFMPFPDELKGEKGERKQSNESADGWRTPSNKAADLLPSEKETTGSKAWGEQLAPADQSGASDSNKHPDELSVQEKPKPLMDSKDLDSDLICAVEKLEIDKSHGEKIREDEKTDEIKAKSGRNRSGRGGRSADQARGGPRQGAGSGASSYRSGRFSGRNRPGRPRGGTGAGNEWPGSESEVSCDEISVSTESGKEEIRLGEGGKRDRRGPRSPKPGRKDDKDSGRRQGYERGAKDGPRDAIRGDGLKDATKEGFAPRGEPSRRGRGSLHTRGAIGRRMDVYGPPPSKGPFGQVNSMQDKANDPGDGSADLSAPLIADSEGGDKKSQPSLNAGVIGSGLRTGSGPPGMPTGPGKPSSGLPGSQVASRMHRKGDDRKDTRRKDRHNNRVNKQNSVDVVDDWESVSENSEGDDRQDVRNGGNAGGGRRGFRGQPGGGPSGQQSERRSNSRRRRNDREKRQGGNSGPPAQSGNGFERRSSNAPQANGRSNNRSGGKMPQGPVAVNRLDDVKLNDPSLVSQAISDLSKKDKDKEKTGNLEGIDLNNYASVVVVDGRPEVAVEEDSSLFDADSGFQEVRNKKTTKDGKKEESGPKGGRGKSQQSLGQSGSGSSFGQSGSNQQPPPLMAINTQPSRSSRSCKLAPRFAKQKENNRLQKQAAAAQHHDVSEMNKMNINMYPLKDTSGPAPPPPVNAWEKPINASLRPNSPSTNLSNLQIGSMADNCMDVGDHGAGSGGSSQRSSPAVDKLREAREARESRDTVTVAAKDAVLDGASPPVQTIIFENTNFKQGPSASKFANHHKGSRMDKGRELDDSTGVSLQSHAVHTVQHSHAGNLGFEMKPDAMAFAKSTEDGVDMKLDFTFECSDLSQLTDDKTAKSIGLPRTMHSNISTADLNFKIAAVKKVWESMPTVMEQGHVDDSQAYASAFPSEGGLDPAAFAKAVESPQLQMDENSDVVYSPGPQIQSNASNYVTSVVSGVSTVGGVSAVPGMMKGDPNSASPNVCKVKPQPSAVMPPGPGAGQLSPPPFNSQPASHIASYQPTLSSNAAPFGGISAIPSPPTVLYNSTQGGLYQTFLGDAQVLGGQPLGGQPLGGQPLGAQALGAQPLGGQPLGGQPRSQFTQFAPYQLSQSLNQQSMYVQSAPPPHPPPSAGPDLFPPLSQYRLQPAAGPFGQSQQLNSNPSTVLISSTSNSLMSASVKPSSHSGQIGAIGTKGGTPGPYQTSAPQPSAQLFIPYDPNQVLGVNQNYLSNSQLVQRAAPVQNIQPSSSFYSTSAGAQAGFYQAGSSLQAAQAAPQLHQTTPFGLQSFSSHSPFLSSNLQIAAAAVQQQQYRSTQPTYLKSGLGQQAQPPPPSSPSGQQPDMLASVFSSGSQIPSPKSRDPKRSQSQSGPGTQNQQSPTPQHQGDQRSGPGGPGGQSSQGHKFSSYQSMGQSSHMLQQNVRGNQMNMGSRNNMGQSGQSRYPSPIQRPVSYGQGSLSSGNVNMNRHRTPAHNTSRPPPSITKQGYYGSSQGGSVKMEGPGSVDSKTEPSNADLKESTPSGKSSTDNSTAAETSKDETAAQSAE